MLVVHQCSVNTWVYWMVTANTGWRAGRFWQTYSHKQECKNLRPVAAVLYRLHVVSATVPITLQKFLASPCLVVGHRAIQVRKTWGPELFLCLLCTEHNLFCLLLLVWFLYYASVKQCFNLYVSICNSEICYNFEMYFEIQFLTFRFCRRFINQPITPSPNFLCVAYRLKSVPSPEAMVLQTLPESLLFTVVSVLPLLWSSLCNPGRLQNGGWGMWTAEGNENTISSHFSATRKWGSENWDCS